VLHEPIQAAVKAILFRHRKVAVQQHVHRRLREPFLVNEKLAARIQQTVHREQFEHLLPRHLAALLAQPRAPELIEPQFAPQPAARPAIPEPPRRAHPQRGEPHLDHIVRIRRRRPVAIREEPALQPRAVLLVDDLQRALPARRLRGVQLAEVKHLPLHHATRMHTQAFAQRVADMLFSVLPADAAFEKHAVRS
jgi:hypothetical protein